MPPPIPPTPVSLPFLALALSLLLWLALRLAATRYRRLMVARLTAMDDLPTVAGSGAERPRINGTAIIAGGSISGLMTARVCSKYFSRVLIVEPEAWTCTDEGLSDDSRPKLPRNGRKPNNRSRVPQYISLHGYQAFSYLAVKEMFPDFDDEARKLDSTAIGPCDYNIHMGGRLLKAPYDAYDGDLPKFAALSRPAYETLLRKLVNKHCDNIEFITGAVSSIELDTFTNRVQSVNIRSKDGTDSYATADLVVDCTGPTCAGIKWLSTTSRPVHVPKVTYDPKMYYTTVEYHVSPNAMADVPIPGGWDNARAIYNYLPDHRMDRRTLLCMKRESNTLQFAVGGFDLAVRPRSIDDVRAFLKSLKTLDPVPEYMFRMLDAVELCGAENSASYVDVRIPPCHFSKYHELADLLPANFVAIGDSHMRVNPVRGQGCTKASVGVVTLSGLLDSCVSSSAEDTTTLNVLPDNFAKMFWQRQHNRVGGIWDQTRAEDYGFETTVPVEGEKRDFGSHIRWYTQNLIAIGRKDPDVANAIYGSAMFLAPGSDVLTPRVIARVLLAGLKEYIGWTKFGV